MKCRKIVFDILQNRNLDLKVRGALILIFADEIQEKIDSNEIEDIKKVEKKYLDQSFINETIKSIEEYKGKESEKYNNINEVFKVFRDLKHINPNDPLGLEDMVYIAHTYSKDVEHLEENIETLAELFETNEVFCLEEVLVTLMN